MKGISMLFCQFGKIRTIIILTVTAAGLLFSNKSFSQIDYYYGRSTEGFRLGVGVAATILHTHYHSYPIKPAFNGILDYSPNPYLCLGIEIQKGTLKGIDSLHHLFFQTSTIQYYSGNFNVKFNMGFFRQLGSQNKFTDILQHTYFGVGVGLIQTNVNFTYYEAARPYLSGIYGPEYLQGVYITVPLSVGTNIDLLGATGTNKIQLNPNIQFNYTDTHHLDGFETDQNLLIVQSYIVFSLNLRFKL